MSKCSVFGFIYYHNNPFDINPLPKREVGGLISDLFWVRVDVKRVVVITDESKCWIFWHQVILIIGWRLGWCQNRCWCQKRGWCFQMKVTLELILMSFTVSKNSSKISPICIVVNWGFLRGFQNTVLILMWLYLSKQCFAMLESEMNQFWWCGTLNSHLAPGFWFPLRLHYNKMKIPCHDLLPSLG